MSEEKMYTGSCHCGNVSYKTSMDLQRAITCNCSMCSRTGAVMAFVPKDSFELLSGQDSLSDYQFNTKKIHHLFCSNCGVRSFARGTDRKGAEMFMVNVRCLEGVDMKAVSITEHDGKSA
ncbi:MAG TPA: GFA family protein [Polyangiaceae bacterium]